MSGSDPLAGIPRPTGSPAALQGIARSWTAGSQVLGRTSQVLIEMTGRVLAQAWSGQAAMACAGECVRDANLIAMSADAYEIGGSALTRFATALADAQAQWDKARRMADQALADEQQHRANAITGAGNGGVPNPLDLFYESPLRASARSLAQDAVTQVTTAGAAAAGVLQGTLQPFVTPKPAPHKKSSSHWYSPVTSFLGGAWDGVKDPVVMLGGLVGLHGSVSQNWSNLGTGLAHGITHPLDLGKALIDWQDLSSGHYAHWAGNLLPSAAAAFFTGGAAAGVKGADALGITAKSGQALEDLSDADKAALLARGEEFVPGAVGTEKATQYITADGRLDYSGVYDDELKNFAGISHNGPVTLDHDLWLSNVHNAKIPLSGGRSLKFSAHLDDLLANSRGGYLDKLALVPQWGPRTDVSIMHIPAGTDIHLAEGTTAAQTSHLTIAGKDLGVPIGTKSGGGVQVLLKDVDKNWVVWSGKAPWPTHAQVLGHAAAGAGVVRVPDVMSDVSQP